MRKTTSWTPAVEDRDTLVLAALLPRRGNYRETDYWLLLVILLAGVVSIVATVYYLNKSETLLYDDAYSHLIIARRVIDSLTPGVDQLGGVWLPLQHVLMLPLIWNDYLWRTGLAGTIPSMVSYIIAAGYLFCILRRLTKQVATGLLGVFIFLCNPNILYLQTTPLTEVMCTAVFAATAYYLLCWLQSFEQKYLVYTAITTLMATLIRYDGWALFLVVSALVIFAGTFRRHNQGVTSDHILIYLSIAQLGIIFWLLWNKNLFDDPLYFQHGPYSAQAHQLDFLHRGELPTYHNIVLSLRIYSIDIGQTVGWGICIAALIGLVLIFVVYKKQQEYFIVAVLLVPFIFYVTSLYMGQSIIELPGFANEKYFFNVRYGAQMVLPVAFLTARGGAMLYSWVRQWYMKTIFMMVCLLCIGMQVIGVNTSGILSLQDGLAGRSCINPAAPVVFSLAQHYNGGRVLVYEFTSDINPQLFDAHFSDIIYEGSGSYWERALVQPTRFVDWVVLNPYNSHDIVASLFTRHRQEFLSSFTLMSSNPDGLQLYYRKGAPPLPTRPIPNDLLGKPHSCHING